MSEILNIDYHRKRLLVKALEKYTIEEAARKLGVSYRTLFRWRKNYGIDLVRISGHQIKNVV